MDRVDLLHKWLDNSELLRLRTTISNGDNYVLHSLNKEFKYLLHNIACVYT